jgi:hypothetical protein
MPSSVAFTDTPHLSSFCVCIARPHALYLRSSDAGWSSLAARRAHNPKVTGSNPVPATRQEKGPVHPDPFVFDGRRWPRHGRPGSRHPRRHGTGRRAGRLHGRMTSPPNYPIIRRNLSRRAVPSFAATRSVQESYRRRSRQRPQKNSTIRSLVRQHHHT